MFVDDIRATGPKGLWDAEGHDTSNEDYPDDSRARWDGQTMTIEKLEMERRLKGHEDAWKLNFANLKPEMLRGIMSGFSEAPGLARNL